jgi:hypothetical protein
MGHCDFPASIPASLDYAKWYLPPSACVGNSTQARRRLGARTVLVQVVPTWFVGEETRDLSSSWGTVCAYALFLDPGRTDPLGRTASRRGPRDGNGEGSHQ